MAEEKSIKRLVLLVELDGKIHQVLLTNSQEAGIKSILQSLPDNVQVISTPLDLEFTTPKDQAAQVEPSEVKSDAQVDVQS